MSDSKKAPIDLVPMRALSGAARVFEHGNTKKDRKPGDFIDRPLDGVFYASTMRHAIQLQRLQGGVDENTLSILDEESGLPALDHLICNLLIIRTMAIRDGLLPEDPKCEQHSQIAAKRKWNGETKTVAIRHMHAGDSRWSSMSAELEPAPLPAPPEQSGSGPTTCGIVDCSACRFADDNDTTNKYTTPGTVRAEGMRW